MAGTILLGYPAMAADCPPADAPPQVSFNVTTTETTLRNDRSRNAIAALAGNHNQSGRMQTGLTQSETSLQVRPSVRWVGVRGGMGCVTLTSVSGAWTQSRSVIDVASQYRPGSCEYQVILDHEREHVRLNRQAFDSQALRLGARLRELAAGMKPFATSDSADRAATRVNRQLMAALKPLTDAFHQETRRANAAIDTEENYRAISAKCRNW